MTASMTIEQAAAIGEAASRVETLEQALANSRFELSEAVKAEALSDVLSNAVNQVAMNEGRLEIARQVSDAMERGAPAERVQAHVMSQVLNGANDSWSGRGNDTKRARFEGVLAEVQHLVRGF